MIQDFKTEKSKPSWTTLCKCTSAWSLDSTTALAFQESSYGLERQALRTGAGLTDCLIVSSPASTGWTSWAWPQATFTPWSSGKPSTTGATPWSMRIWCRIPTTGSVFSTKSWWVINHNHIHVQHKQTQRVSVIWLCVFVIYLRILNNHAMWRDNLRNGVKNTKKITREKCLS